METGKAGIQEEKEKMSDIRVEIKQDNTKEVKKALEEALDAAMEAVGIQAEGYAKLNLETNPRRVDTGLLRNSITYVVAGQPPHINSYHADKPSEYGAYKIGRYMGTQPKESTPAVYIGTNVEYAPYVHEGSKTVQPPNRFLKNAAQGHEEEYKRLIETVLEG